MEAAVILTEWNDDGPPPRACYWRIWLEHWLRHWGGYQAPHLRAIWNHLLAYGSGE